MLHRHAQRCVRAACLYLVDLASFRVAALQTTGYTIRASRVCASIGLMPLLSTATAVSRLMQGICGNNYQHLHADSPGLCDESTHSFQKPHFFLFCQVQTKRMKTYKDRTEVKQFHHKMLAFHSHRYQAGEGMLELCDDANMPPCMFLRRLLEQPPWCFSEQVNTPCFPVCKTATADSSHAQPNTSRCTASCAHLPFARFRL